MATLGPQCHMAHMSQLERRQLYGDKAESSNPIPSLSVAQFATSVLN